jgi:hypothetical protein
VVAPRVAAPEWRLLAADLRAGWRVATLPCCGGLAFGRVSAQGLAHFVHQRRGGCAGARESLAHLALKAAVAQACVAAGWSVEPEAAGPDWRADVLATPQLPTGLDDLLGRAHHRQPWRVAFEVQLSRIDGVTVLERQARYARDRVRGCWLVHPSVVGLRRPSGASTPGPMGGGEAAVLARLGLPPEVPAFPLVGGEEPAVLCAGQPIPLAAFVTALLGRRVRFVAQMAPAERPLRVLIYEVWCPACRQRCHAHLVAGQFLARCGAQGRLQRVEGSTPAGQALEFDPEVRAAVHARIGAPAGQAVRQCPVRPTDHDGRRLGFHCPGCGLPLPPGHLAHAAWPVRQGVIEPVATLALTEVAGVRCCTEEPHWCYAPDGRGCGHGNPSELRTVRPG